MPSVTQPDQTDIRPAFAGSPPAPIEPMQLQPQDQETGELRGGNRSEACPGRFCFIVPCPIPCDFCIF